jgi:hypothetical protein
LIEFLDHTDQALVSTDLHAIDLDRVAEAIADCDEAIRLQPSWYAAYFWRGHPGFAPTDRVRIAKYRGDRPNHANFRPLRIGCKVIEPRDAPSSRCVAAPTSKDPQWLDPARGCLHFSLSRST